MKTPYESGRAWIELNLKNLEHNVKAVKSILPRDCELMAVVKANAYGHGAVPIAFSLNAMGVNAFCVATITEAIQLRECGVIGEILILGYTHPVDFPLLNRYELTQAVISYDYAQLLDSYTSNIRVHVAIDTGMHRAGVDVRDIDTILAKKPEDFLAFLQMLEAAGYEIKQGKNIALRGKSQKRFIRLSSLGDGYAEADLRAVISGTRAHAPKSKYARTEQPVNVLLNVQQKLQEKRTLM